MTEFFEKTFYNNTIAEWAVAFAIMAGAFMLAKVIYFLLSTIVKKVAKNTKTKLDDIIVDMLEEPLVFGIAIAGFWYSTSFLNTTAGADVFIEKVLYIVITFNVAWAIVRLVDAILVEYLTPLVQKSDSDLDDQLLPIVRKVIKSVLWAIAIIVGLNNAGYDVGALIAGLGIGGLAFAMAAKDSVANLFGGITVFTDKPFIIHDRIKVSGVDGNVEEIGIRSTKITTLEGRKVTIPNSVFIDGIIENVTSEPARKVSMTLGLTYDTKHEKVQEAIDILKNIVTTNESINDNYLASFSGFGDFSLNILFIYRIKAGEDNMGVQNAVNFEILKRYNAAQIDFAFPTQTIITENAS